MLTLIHPSIRWQAEQPFCGIALSAIQKLQLVHPGEVSGVEHGLLLRMSHQEYLFHSKDAETIQVLRSTYHPTSLRRAGLVQGAVQSDGPRSARLRRHGEQVLACIAPASNHKCIQQTDGGELAGRH